MTDTSPQTRPEVGVTRLLDSTGRIFCGLFSVEDDMTDHERDEDCAPYIVDGLCSVCGVDHDCECHICGGHGFHKPGCQESDASID